ncbi:MAG: hypothetical protein HQK49_22950 [Oligoflexia bacterium]|nr:hypothetical protein [Oligoflexia bacterium]
MIAGGVLLLAMLSMFSLAFCSDEEGILIEKLKLKQELTKKIHSNLKRIQIKLMVANPAISEEFLNKEISLINETISTAISNGINLEQETKSGTDPLNFQTWGVQLITKFNIASIDFQDNKLKIRKVENPPAEGVIAKEILGFMKDFVALDKYKNKETSDKLIANFNNFKSKYPDYVKIISLALQNSGLAKVDGANLLMVAEKMPLDGSDQFKKNVLGELKNFSSFFANDKQIAEFKSDYEDAINYTKTYIKSKISIESLPQLLNWQCSQFNNLPEELKIIKMGDEFLTAARLKALNTFYTTIKESSVTDLQLFENSVIEINKTLKKCEMGEITFSAPLPTGAKKISYKPSSKELLLKKRANSLKEVLILLREINYKGSRIEDKKLRDTIVEINKIIKESKLAPFYKRDISPIVKEINETAAIYLKINSLEFASASNGDGELVVNELKDAKSVDLIKNEIKSFFEDLITFREDKDPKNSSNHLQGVAKKFEDFKTKYADYLNVLITCLAPSGLVDVTKKSLLSSDAIAAIGKVKLLRSLGTFTRIFFEDQEMSRLLNERYTKIDSETMKEGSFSAIDRSKCLELNDEEVAAVKLFSSDEGCRIINLQNRILPWSLEELTDPSNALGWIAQTIARGILDGILPARSIYDSSGLSCFTGTSSEAMKYINGMIKGSKMIFLKDLESLNNRYLNSDNKYSTKDITKYFNSGVCKLPNESGCFYHGIPASSSLDNKNLKVGDTITLPDFLSTSSSKERAWPFSENTGKFALVVSKTAKEIKQLSSIKEEDEHLLLPKTKLRIIDIIKTTPRMIGFGDFTDDDEDHKDYKIRKVDMDRGFTLILVEEV